MLIRTILIVSILSFCLQIEALAENKKSRELVAGKVAPQACINDDYSVYIPDEGFIKKQDNPVVTYTYECCATRKQSGFKPYYDKIKFGYYTHNTAIASYATFKKFINPSIAVKDEKTGKWWVGTNSKTAYIPACKVKITKSIIISTEGIKPLELVLPKPDPIPGPFGPWTQ